jgi:hypothetical protein
MLLASRVGPLFASAVVVAGVTEVAAAVVVVVGLTPV